MLIANFQYTTLNKLNDSNFAKIMNINQDTSLSQWQ